MFAFAGTPYWVAPEVFAGQRYSEKADVYSFSIVLMEMIMDGNIVSVFGGLAGMAVASKVMAGWRCKIPKQFKHDKCVRDHKRCCVAV